MFRRLLPAALLALVTLNPQGHAQQSGPPIKIGVMGDESGPFSASGGLGTVHAVQMAVDDVGGQIGGRTIEVIHADHQNKPDVALTLARRWFDIDGIDVIVNLTSTPVALAVQELARERKRSTIITGSSSTELTGKACSPYSTQWLEDSYTLSAGIVNGVYGEGRKRWFFVTLDNAFGESMLKEASKRLEQLGGTVVGSVRHPLNTHDLSSFLVQASSANAEVVALANVGADTATAIKQAREFGIPGPGRTLTAFFFFLSDIHGMGLDAAQGLLLSNGFYWDQNASTRAFSERFETQMKMKPSDAQGISYAAMTHWLKAVAKSGTSDAGPVNAAMREIPVEFFGTSGQVRADGRATFDVGLYRVKEPARSSYSYDYMQLVRYLTGEEAFRPLAESECPLVTNRKP